LFPKIIYKILSFFCETRVTRTRETGSERFRRFAQNNHTMPDSFFATKTRKRKRTSSKVSGPSSSKKVLKTSNINGRVSAKGKGKARAADEELHSGGSGSEALDDVDLRTDEGNPNESGDEDAGETPAGRDFDLRSFISNLSRMASARLFPPALTVLALITLRSGGMFAFS
jgi:hypothetical protein